MLRKNLPPIDAYLADAVSLDAPAFVKRHPWPFLLIPEPRAEIMDQLSRPDTLLQENETIMLEGDPTSGRMSGASLDALCLEVRPKRPTASRITLGRSPDADVVLIDQTISRFHAEIEWDPTHEGAVLFDLGAKNGVYVDDARVPAKGRAPLVPGAVVIFGELVTRYHSPRSFHAWLCRGAPRAGAAPGQWPSRS
jgi:hypothetical protein